MQGWTRDCDVMAVLTLMRGKTAMQMPPLNPAERPRPPVILLATLLLSVLIAPGANAQLYATPIAAPNKLYQLDGYAVTAPQGQGWFEMKRERHFIYFGKRLSSPTHSFIAIALLAPVEETFETAESFRDHVARQLAGNPGDMRSKVNVTAVEVDPTAGPFCVRYQTKTEDRGATNAKGKSLLAETFGLSCLHANRKNPAIDLSYTERGLPGETGTVLRDEGENFIRSLQFTPRR